MITRREMIVGGIGGGLLVGAAGVMAVVANKETCKCVPDNKKPPERAELHICAFHIGKDNPNFVVEVDHYCSGLSDELFQCLLYDSAGKGARLLGVEYVISDKLYNTLDEEEKKLWHPHKYEINQGLLVCPGMPLECEEKTMKALVNSWGKTWHTWPDPKTQIPLGKPILMWSAEKDGDVPTDMVKQRDKRLNINTEEIKDRRKKYLK